MASSKDEKNLKVRKPIKKNVMRLTLCAMLLALCLPSEAQQPKKIPLIGYLSSNVSGRASDSTRIETIRLALRELGYIEGQNMAFEYRYAEGKRDRYAELAAELVSTRLISSWSQEGHRWSAQPGVRPRRFPSL